MCKIVTASEVTSKAQSCSGTSSMLQSKLTQSGRKLKWLQKCGTNQIPWRVAFKVSQCPLLGKDQPHTFPREKHPAHNWTGKDSTSAYIFTRRTRNMYVDPPALRMTLEQVDSCGDLGDGDPVAPSQAIHSLFLVPRRSQEACVPPRNSKYSMGAA